MKQTGNACCFLRRHKVEDFLAQNVMMFAPKQNQQTLREVGIAIVVDCNGWGWTKLDNGQ
jgi:hypothetical protein